MANLLFAFNCVYAEPVKPLMIIESSTVFKEVRTNPLSKLKKEENLKTYHAKLDLMNDVIFPIMIVIIGKWNILTNTWLRRKMTKSIYFSKSFGLVETNNGYTWMT